jgi:hypothetical protein
MNVFGVKRRTGTRSPAATVPATTNPAQASQEQPTVQEGADRRQQLSWQTPPHTRTSFVPQEPPPVVYSASKPRLMERPPTFVHRPTHRDNSPDEENVRRLFETRRTFVDNRYGFRTTAIFWFSAFERIGGKMAGKISAIRSL